MSFGNQDIVLIVVSFLLIVSVLAGKASDRIGVPALLMFLVIGMLAGPGGFGWIQFSDVGFARYIGTLSLVFILFAGGLVTRFEIIRPVLRPGVLLATVGVALTAGLTAVFAVRVLGMPILQALLLGSVVSATDAAAVFTVLRSRNAGLAGRLRPLIEFESGSNDPMAIFLAVGIIHSTAAATGGPIEFVRFFFQQAMLGGLFGFIGGRGLVLLHNRVRFWHEGLYPVLTFASVMLVYAVTSFLEGSGFLAAYLMGITAGNREFIHRRSVIRFYDGIAWLAQITMFLTLGLLASPSRLLSVSGAGIAVAFFLMLVARPLSVFASLAGSGFSVREQAMVAWVGLRGASPIVLSIFPMLAGIHGADYIASVVFFVVIVSVLVQGTTLAWVARLLGVSSAYVPEHRPVMEFDESTGLSNNLRELIVPYGSAVAGRAVVDLCLPPDSLIALISRGGRFIVPNGGTVLEEGDVLFILASDAEAPFVQRILACRREDGGRCGCVRTDERRKDL